MGKLTETQPDTCLQPDLERVVVGITESLPGFLAVEVGHIDGLGALYEGPTGLLGLDDSETRGVVVPTTHLSDEVGIRPVGVHMGSEDGPHHPVGEDAGIGVEYNGGQVVVTSGLVGIPDDIRGVEPDHDVVGGFFQTDGEVVVGPSCQWSGVLVTTAPDRFDGGPLGVGRVVAEHTVGREGYVVTKHQLVSFWVVVASSQRLTV